MLSIRNIQFSKLVKAEGRFREFNFRKSANDVQVVFNLDVTDDRNNRILFRMQKEDNAWKIQSKELPVWIINTETNLCELIEHELQA
jgi:hypothetical protein